MATTSEWAIVYPTVSNTITPLATHFANLANSVETALNKGARLIGTNAERLALTSPARRTGLVFYTTDTDREHMWDGSAWRIHSAPKTVFTPTWSNFTPGGSTVVASYGISAGRLYGDVSVTLASGWSMSGDVVMFAPAAAEAPLALRSLGTGVILDSGSGYYRIRTLQTSSGNVELWRESSDFMGKMNGTSPITFATNDQFHFNFAYFI